MNDRTRPLPAMPAIARILVVTVIIIVAGAAAAQSSKAPGSAEFGDFYWPPNGIDGPSELERLGRRVLNASDPLVIGPEPVERVRIDRINATSSRLTVIREGQTNMTFLQRHLPPRVSNDTLSENRTVRVERLAVTPSMLHPTIWVYGVSGLKVRAPPGEWNVTGETVSDREDALLAKVGLPSPRFRDEGPDRYSSLGGFQGREEPLFPSDPSQCTERSGGKCTVTTEFVFRCTKCSGLRLKVHPAPGSELTAAAGGGGRFL